MYNARLLCQQQPRNLFSYRCSCKGIFRQRWKPQFKKYAIMSQKQCVVLPLIQDQSKFYKLNTVFFSTDSSVTCWNCSNVVKDIFCDKCKVLQKVNKENDYFQLLGLEYNYDVDLPGLSKKYRRLQSVLHPDKFGNKSNEEKAISEEYSSIINKAYSTLMNPIYRGLYMMKLKGITIEEGTVQLDPTFLMEIMEKNEELEQLTEGNKISEFNEINKDIIIVLIKDLSTAFKKNDVSAAKAILTKLKYFSSIDSKIKEMKQKLGLPD